MAVPLLTSLYPRNLCDRLIVPLIAVLLVICGARGWTGLADLDRILRVLYSAETRMLGRLSP